MDWLEFISSVLRSLAWPAVVAVGFFMFRGALERMLPDLRRMKAGPAGLELEWVDRKLEEVREELKEPSDTERELLPKEEVAQERTFLDEIGDLASVSPDAAVAEAYRRLETVLRRTLLEVTPEVTGNLSVRRLAEMALRNELITHSELSAIDDLRGLRNQIVHSANRQPIDRDQALEYAQLAWRVIHRIEESRGEAIKKWQQGTQP